jgi:hypothetical protein
MPPMSSLPTEEVRRPPTAIDPQAGVQGLGEIPVNPLPRLHTEDGQRPAVLTARP